MKFFEFLHLYKVIFYLRFRGSMYICTPHASKNEDFRSKSPYPLNAKRILFHYFGAVICYSKSDYIAVGHNTVGAVSFKVGVIEALHKFVEG